MPRSDVTSAQYRLNVYAPDESTRIEIFDGNLRPVPLDQSLGDVSVELPAGVYVVRFYQGSHFTAKLAVLMPGSPVVKVSLLPQEQPEFATAAPVLHTTTTSEWQRKLARDLSRSAPLPPPAGHSGGSHVLLFLRDPFPPGDLPVGVTLHDLHGELLFDLTKAKDRDQHAQWMSAHLNLDPGAYRLRRDSPRGLFVEQLVFTRQGWQTQIFLMTAERGEEPKEIARTSILMVKSHVGFDFEREDFRRTESALRALESRRNIPGSVRSEMLWVTFENPMLGIYAGLLHLRRQEIDVTLMREVFANLYGLVGPLPDVLAIGWAVAMRDEATHGDTNFMAQLRDPAAFATPPMLRESWEHILRANADERNLIPARSLADRIGGRLIAGSPWLAWLGELPSAAILPPGVADSKATPVSSVVAPVSSRVRSFAAAFVRPLIGLAVEVGLVGISKLVKSLFHGATKFTLQTVLTGLAKLLSRYPEARFWLQTKRFSDLERHVAYWLQPTLDPRLDVLIEDDPSLGRKLMDTARERVADVVSLLTELNVSSNTALGAAWGVFIKLFIQPVLPNEERLKTFVQQESRGHVVLATVLSDLRKTPAHLHHPPSGRTLNLLEFAFLYYRGSPAEGIVSRVSIEQLTARLDEAGFVFGKEQRRVTASDLSLQHTELRQHVIRGLEPITKRRWLPFPPTWQLSVFPPLEQYSRGNLFPLSEDVNSTNLAELTKPIKDEALPDLRLALTNLQGNILSGHGRDRTGHIFLRFKSDQQLGVKQWIQRLAELVTSAQQQLEEVKQYRQYGIPGRLFMSFFLSASGYEYLGLDPANNSGFDDEAFLHGMKAAQYRLNDPPREVWEEGYKNDIHAMVLLADDDESYLLRETQQLSEDINAYAEICTVEYGRVMRNVRGDSVEHFGYADNHSQPLFFQEDIDRGRQEENITSIWDPGAGPDLALVPDPYGKEHDSNGRVVNHHSGSYLVFRKLEQNVRAFKEREQKLAKVLGLSGKDAQRAGALVVGRFEDGTPVVLQPTAGRPTNSFTYDEDPGGGKCPLQAHIRKVNPRKKNIPRIVRRGITYRKRWEETKDYPGLDELPSEDVGLLFMCYQRNIKKQFEFLQGELANYPLVPREQEPGIDPVIGQLGESGAGQQKWPAQWNELREKHKPFDFYGFVTFKGGEYFFAPSVYFLRNIMNTTFSN
jgi:Dyp-type peroxidase family